MNKNTVYKLIFAFCLVFAFAKANNALACDPCYDYQPVPTYYGNQNLNSSMNGSSSIPQNSNPIPHVQSSTYGGTTVVHTTKPTTYKPTVKKDCCDCDCGCLNEYEKLALANYSANYASAYSDQNTTKSSSGFKLSDFFPHTFWGWLLVFVLIFSIFVAYKYATKKKKAEAPKTEDSNLPKIA